MTGFDAAQAQYDAQTPPYDDYYPIVYNGIEIWDEDADCTCEPDAGDDGQPIMYRKHCRRHSEPPCDWCGWQASCQECVGT